jgi:hypothetical protein
VLVNPHAVTAEETNINIFTAVRASNLILFQVVDRKEHN